MQARADQPGGMQPAFAIVAANVFNGYGAVSIEARRIHEIDAMFGQIAGPFRFIPFKHLIYI
jgi:hypothetical protein